MDRIFKTNEDEIEHLFTYHSPTPEQNAKYCSLRSAAKTLAHVIYAACPGGADRSAAIRLLRECVMTANASIALAPNGYNLAEEPLNQNQGYGAAAAGSCSPVTEDRKIPYTGRY